VLRLAGERLVGHRARFFEDRDGNGPAVHLPHASTLPRVITTGDIQPAVLLISALRPAGIRWTSCVPGPRTYWSNPGSKRTVVVGLVVTRSSTSTASASAGSPSTVTVVT
jgi:hypothetical protein